MKLYETSVDLTTIGTRGTSVEIPNGAVIITSYRSGDVSGRWLTIVYGMEDGWTDE